MAANWQLGELQGLCNAANLAVEQCRVGPAALADLLKMVENHEVTGKVAKEVLASAFESGESPAAMVQSQGLGQVSDAEQIAAMVDEVLVQNYKAAADYQGGKDQAFRALVGAVMAKSKGRANSEVVNQLLRERLPRVGD